MQMIGKKTNKVIVKDASAKAKGKKRNAKKQRSKEKWRHVRR
jgi:hypothetical protein